MTYRTRVILTALYMAAVACRTRPVRSSVGRATLDSLNAGLDAAFRAGDVARVGAYFATDAQWR